MAMNRKKVFISYCSKQGPWVWDRLVACLRAGGAEVLIDRERFRPGKDVYTQMDDAQDKAHIHVLVLSEDYLNSKPCRHEMDRAIALDPDFQTGTVIPVMRENCKRPAKIAKPNPLYVDLRHDKDAAKWRKLLTACGADLGTDAPAWLDARDEIREYLRRGDSVNLVVKGKVKWSELIADLTSETDPKGTVPALARVDLEPGSAASRHGLVKTIVRALGGKEPVPEEPDDLVEMDRFIAANSKSYLTLERFDWVAYRPQYGVDLFGTLRNLVTDQRKLVLMIQSRAPLQTLLPIDHPMSSEFTSLKTVELRARP